MNELITFAQTASPLAILALAVGGLVYVIYNQYKKDKPDNGLESTISEHLARFDDIDSKLEKIASNHLHELPDIMRSVGRIEKTVNEIAVKQEAQGNRITRLEAINEVKK